jgi:hypothetical protein
LSAEAKLPAEILVRATKSGKEFAWPIEDIPQVIEAARQENLLNLGGQLQFILPDGICELYWIEVDPLKKVPETLSWRDKVECSASEALAAFDTLRKERDFIAEGRKAFPDYLAKYEKAGGILNDVMRFVWYVDAQPNS